MSHCSRAEYIYSTLTLTYRSSDIHLCVQMIRVNPYKGTRKKHSRLSSLFLQRSVNVFVGAKG